MDPTDPDREEEMPTAATPEAALEAPYQIDEGEGELVVRVPASLVSAEQMAAFLDQMDFQRFQEHRRAGEANPPVLTPEAKEAVWEANRERALELFRQFPREMEVEEIIEQLYVIAMIERGLRDDEEGRVVSHEEVRRQFGL